MCKNRDLENDVVVFRYRKVSILEYEKCKIQNRVFYLEINIVRNLKVYIEIRNTGF